MGAASSAFGAATRRQIITGRAIVLFANAEMAEASVAGVPAAARVVRALGEAGLHAAVIALSHDDRTLNTATLREIARLSEPLPVTITSAQAAEVRAGDWLIAGATVPSASRITAAMHEGQSEPGLRRAEDSDSAETLAPIAAMGGSAALAAAARQIVRSTAKPGDGIVSRHINRPISQAISNWLLRWPQIRPVHATYGTAALAVAMIACLLLGGAWGLIAGAFLFQAASIFDGVDGEIARATFRTSPQGARLDSLIDAATNLSFLGGVAVNLYLQGLRTFALAGATGMALLLTGLTIIGWRSRRRAEGLTFNAVKERVNAGQSRVMQWLTWLTMRDFFALAMAVLISVGLAGVAMVAFAVIAAGWLVVVIATMHREHA